MVRSLRTAALAALSAMLVTGLAAAPASAADDAKPDAAHLRQAAEAFDAGVTAYKAHDFEGAASHFEAADAAVPSAKTLRQAIRARAEAGQGARAATLAALALARYPGDDATVKLAHETIDKVEPLVAKVSVSCASPCVISVAALAVPGEASARWTVYLDPGEGTFRARFAGGSTSAPQKVDVTAGGAVDLHFEEEKKKAAPVLVPVPVSTASTPDKNELPPADPAAEEPKPEPRGITPVVFGVFAAATVGLGVATIWSGVDTLNNPGTAAVKAGCVGQGTSCPLYQEGLAHQQRTNILAGVTGGAAVVTVVLGFFTRWHGAKKEPPAGLSPAALVVDRGAVLGAAGVF
jgi:hypothetical protein